MAKLVPGVNDLATLRPDIAAEAYGWDPSKVCAGSSKKVSWRCLKGHTWEATPNKRTWQRSCPYCANKKVWVGFNDLKTLFPEIAKEADGWDPSTVLPGSHKKMTWRCSKGHSYLSSLTERTRRNRGCPYCSGNKVLVGFNDLKTKFPDIAKEANGWDPSTISPGSGRKVSWKCKEGHTWIATPNGRTCGTDCPYCSCRKILVGFNDLKTKFPDIAKEADGWDPSKVFPGSTKKVSWRCQKNHFYKSSVLSRTGTHKTSCPYCSGNKVLVGFNDLKTKFPDIAKEADGWDPSTFTSASTKKLSWRCQNGHNWITSIGNRTRSIGSTGCPECAEYGFNPGKPTWFYLMERKGQQQIGITNTLQTRIKKHASYGWKTIEVIGPHNGQIVLDTETELKKWLKEKIGLVEGTTENWYTSKMEVHSLAELKKKSGIKTSIF